MTTSRCCSGRSRPTCFPDVRLAGVSGALVALLLYVVVARAHHFHLLFTLHVGCMSSAFLVFMAQGIMAYTQPPEHRAESRSLHMWLQIAAATLAATGFGAIAWHKAELGKNMVSLSYHATAGWLVLLGVVTQALIGGRKVYLLQSGLRQFPWHGLLGWTVFAGGVLTIGLGVLATASDVAWPLILLALLLLYFTWVAFAFRRGKMAAAAYSPVPSSEGDVELQGVGP